MTKGINNYEKSVFKEITVVEPKEHQGLANSIIRGVSKVIKDYKKVIVLEDDLEVSYYFLEYMNQALQYYRKDK